MQHVARRTAGGAVLRRPSAPPHFFSRTIHEFGFRMATRLISPNQALHRTPWSRLSCIHGVSGPAPVSLSFGGLRASRIASAHDGQLIRCARIVRGLPTYPHGQVGFPGRCFGRCSAPGAGGNRDESPLLVSREYFDIHLFQFGPRCFGRHRPCA